MKTIKNFLTTALFLLLVISNILVAQDSTKTTSKNNGNLILKITGFDSDEGYVMIALCNSQENYDMQPPYIGTGAEIVEGKSQHIFENLPYGEYAIKCFHDENTNGKLDTNIMGIPKESYGFSNNATGSFGPAKYEDAKFKFSKDSQVAEIEVH